MANIQTRNSVLAIMVESTEGTPVVPSASTDFTALQDDADMSAAFETLENAELKSSLGSAKPIQGVENPTFSFSHYLRHSGVEGQAPDYNELLKGVFGNEEVNATEYDTIAASTEAVIKVDAGEGATFSKGEALLIKDSTNGYRVRNVESISTDDLTLGFELPSGAAPATGVNLGKAVFYSPADSGHQSLSIWHYLGNGGAIQMMAGAKVTELSISATAGELVNASYSLEGLEYFYNPIDITSSDIYLDFTDDGGTHAAVITAKTYKDPHQLAEAIQNAMNTVQTAETHSVTYSNTDGKFTIATSTSTVLSLLWNTGANTANTVGDKLGFSVAADDTGATTYEGDSAISYAAPATPSFDSSDPLVAKNSEVLLGDADDVACFNATSITVTLSDTRRPIESICATTGRSGSIINERTATVEVTALLEQYEADKFRKFRENETTRFAVNFGQKDGSGNWVAGKVANVYLPTCVISAFDLADDDGLVSLSMTLTAFVNDSGEGEIFLNLL